MKTIDATQLKEINNEGHTSKGNQPKWKKDSKWYKADHMGYEALSEIVVSKLLKQTNAVDFIEYRPVFVAYNNRKLCGCESDNFLPKDNSLIVLEKLHRLYDGRGMASVLSGLHDVSDKISYTVDFIEQKTGLKNVGEYLTMMLEIDALFLNEDRHTNNIAVIYNEPERNYSLCPFFDHGLSLLSDTTDYPLSEDIYTCIKKVRAKPFAASFEEQVDAAEELYGVQLQCKFIKHDLEMMLNELSVFYDQAILFRVSELILEQMRRYSYFWK